MLMMICASPNGTREKLFRDTPHSFLNIGEPRLRPDPSIIVLSTVPPRASSNMGDDRLSGVWVPASWTEFHSRRYSYIFPWNWYVNNKKNGNWQDRRENWINDKKKKKTYRIWC